MDPESLEQENDQGIEALGERTRLLRQVRGCFLSATFRSSQSIPVYSGAAAPHAVILFGHSVHQSGGCASTDRR